MKQLKNIPTLLSRMVSLCLYGVLFFGPAGLLSGCDSELEIANAVPRVTWVAVQRPIDDDKLAVITVWISDVEGDPVDLDVTVLRNGETEPLTLDAAGHGLVGLTTQDARFEVNGQPHLLLWDTSGLPADADVQLRFLPDDRKGGLGLPALSPKFGLDVGLKEAMTVSVETP